MHKLINTLIFGSRTALAVLCLSVASAVFVAVPSIAQAMTYAEDFDSLEIDTFFPSPWTGNTDRYYVRDDQSYSVPNSIRANHNSIYAVDFDAGSTTRGLLYTLVYAEDITNFTGAFLAVTNQVEGDEYGIQMRALSGGANRRFECGRQDSGSVEIDSYPWEIGQWYGMFVEYRVVPDIGGDFVSVRCGYQRLGHGVVWSSWIDSNPLHIDHVDMFTYMTSLSGTGAYYADNFSFATDADYDELELDSTRVISVAPVTRNGSLTATSTEMITSVTGFVNEDDYVEGMKVTITAFRLSSVQQTSMVMAWENATNTAPHRYNVSFDIDASGEFNFSTTVDTSEFILGTYSIVAEIVYPLQTNNFLQSTWQTLMSALERANGTQPAMSPIRYVDRFIIAEATWYDDLVTQVTGERDMALSKLDSCNPFDSEFDIIDCLLLLVLPTPSDLAEIWDRLYTDLFTKVPFGYITRFVEIMSLNGGVIPPAVVYTFGTSSPVDLQGMTIDFQIFDPANWTLISEIESDSLTNPKNVWEIIMPYINMIIGLGVLGVILQDLLRMGSVQNYGGGRSRRTDAMDTSDIDRMKINDYSQISEDEWQTLKRNRLI